ncbi:PDC sensor domain-containing protein [Gilvimarinus sp. SDUM040013]|uniref:PDC sensor domain-containing protein n=1 Tax=Gilvimarinus gilvus TaxID=3058038 RepID=A0ABU4RV24_9GAMM|nr:PDC sensor domain-containing protein [Gilvimarinus sp. SDUM040013]MDO3387909.1 PDC sensor domain-containing protein [Gilvimarinus sp. SDUM040013]MDX6848720.1 PDC sensor domain-containing protein [Gilvimarinus sp. SDUM040013]
MKKEFLSAVGLLLSVVMGVGAQAQDPAHSTVLMGTNEASAYSDEKVSLGRDGSLTYVDCIFSRIPYQLELKVQPWRRVQQEVRAGNMAGFFTAMPSPVFEQFASLTNPLVLEKWYWFSLPGTASAEELGSIRTGAILGSHQQQWLEFNGVTEYLAAQDLPQLIKLMLAGRINTILADYGHFAKAAGSLGVDPADYRAQFFQYVPLGVYFGHHFLEDNPRFLKLFNQQIPHCVPEGFSLTPKEQTVIRSRLRDHVQSWQQHSVLLDRMQWHYEQPALTDQELLHRDTVWREAFNAGDLAPMLELQDEQLTGFLGLWKTKVSYVTEIIITDKQGANIAVAPYTSDYWQGDEAKHLQAYTMDTGSWLFSDVLYDQSTRRFQTQISMPIDVNGQRVGVMTIGVDIEKALGH